MEDLRKDCIKAAKMAADWIVRNQSLTDGSADWGRYQHTLTRYELRNPARTGKLTTNWTTGNCVLSLLLMNEVTGKNEYLDSAAHGCKYLKSLQTLDFRSKRICGMIREDTPQCSWCHPRDALTAAWAMLHFGIKTGDMEYVDRARIFAEWFKTYSFKKGYPAWSYYLEEGRPPLWLMGSFHGGSAMFFMDLYEYTGEKQWLDKVALPIVKTYCKIFSTKDGYHKIVVDPQTGRDLTGVDSDVSPLGWQHMHRFNDDFTALSLMKAYKLTGTEKYLNVAGSFLDWAIAGQNRNGSFGKPLVPSAGATLAIELVDMHRITKGDVYLRSAEKAVGYLLKLQETEIRDKRAFGGVYGNTVDFEWKSRHTLNVRVSSYAVAAFAKWAEQHEYTYYSA